MADANTPDWLKQGQAPAPAPVNNGPTTFAPPPPPPTTDVNLNDVPLNEEDDPELPRMILIMRLANMGAACALIAVSIWSMTTFSSFSSFVLATYATCGGLLICCLETQLKFVRVMIALNFGFLFNSVWRFIFYLLLGSICWSFDSIPGKAMAFAFGGVAIFNTYVLCRFPAYRKIREKIAEEEDKRIEARISKEVKRQAASQIMGK